MDRYLHSPRALAAIGVAVGALTVLFLSLFQPDSRCVRMEDGIGRTSLPSCAEYVESGWRFKPFYDDYYGFELHWLLVGAVVAASTYAVLVLAILSVRAIRGKGTTE